MRARKNPHLPVREPINKPVSNMKGNPLTTVHWQNFCRLRLKGVIESCLMAASGREGRHVQFQYKAKELETQSGE
jgi:hypothetical protein